MNQDSFYRLTQHVLIEDTWLVDAARLLIVFFAWLTAALLAKLYWTHQTGKMNGTAAVGAVMTYFVVGYAQIINLASPFAPNSLTFLNVLVLIAMIISLRGTCKVMHVGLFRKKDDK